MTTRKNDETATRYALADLIFVIPPGEGRECEDDYTNHAHKADWFDEDFPEAGATLEWLRAHYRGVDVHGVGLTVFGEAGDLLESEEGGAA